MFSFLQALLQVCERIPTIGTQLKILSTVKATMLGSQGKKILFLQSPEFPYNNVLPTRERFCLPISCSVQKM